MNKTKIEWADFTWNPVTGCLGPKGDGVRCSYCYAHRLAKGRLRERYLSYTDVIAGDPADPFAPRWAKCLMAPMFKTKPRRIFVGSMTDLFGGWMSDGVMARIMTTVRCSPQHTFMFLTKWPQNLVRLNPWPDNCWVGATATNEDEAWSASAHLAFIRASVRYLSIEPLLSPIDPVALIPFDWIIVGAQTGPGAKPVDREALREIIQAADERRIPLFLKDNLKLLAPRQEFPKVAP